MNAWQHIKLIPLKIAHIALSFVPNWIWALKYAIHVCTMQCGFHFFILNVFKMHISSQPVALKHILIAFTIAFFCYTVIANLKLIFIWFIHNIKTVYFQAHMCWLIYVCPATGQQHRVLQLQKGLLTAGFHFTHMYAKSHLEWFPARVHW